MGRRQSPAQILLELPPNHLIHHTHVALDDADNLRGDILVHIIRYGDARQTVANQAHCHIYALQQADSINPAQHKATLIQGLRALSRSPDAHCRERMSYKCKEILLSRQMHYSYARFNTNGHIWVTLRFICC